MTSTTAHRDAAAEQFVGGYGPAWRTGVLIDHTDSFVAAGGRLRVGRNATWAVLPTGRAIPVVCGEIVRIDTEDGPMSGRCGLNVFRDLGACDAHAEERQGWMDMSEAERCAWERDRDRSNV